MQTEKRLSHRGWYFAPDQCPKCGSDVIQQFVWAIEGPHWFCYKCGHGEFHQTVAKNPEATVDSGED